MLPRLQPTQNRRGREYAYLMQNVLALYHADQTPITGAAICSVVPGMADILHQAANFLTDGLILEVGAGVKTGLNIKIAEPRTLGTDRVVTAVYASHTYPMPCVIVDLGTATTYTVLDKTGALVGSAIAAGVRLSLSALNEHTAQLPTVGLLTFRHAYWERAPQKHFASERFMARQR